MSAPAYHCATTIGDDMQASLYEVAKSVHAVGSVSGDTADSFSKSKSKLGFSIDSDDHSACENDLVVSHLQRAKPVSVSMKTRLCRFYRSGICKKGLACSFVHSMQELRGKPELSFTKFCNKMNPEGYCADPYCIFAHSQHELRTLDSPAAVQVEPSVSANCESGPVPNNAWQHRRRFGCAHLGSRCGYGTQADVNAKASETSSVPQSWLAYEFEHSTHKGHMVLNALLLDRPCRPSGVQQIDGDGLRLLADLLTKAQPEQYDD